MILENRLIDFVSRMLGLVDALPKKATARHLGGQMMRSGTSPALNYGEARAAESKADFMHKLKICLKELRETHVALRIVQKQKWFSGARLEPILDECNQLIAAFVASLKKATPRASQTMIRLPNPKKPLKSKIVILISPLKKTSKIIHRNS